MRLCSCARPHLSRGLISGSLEFWNARGGLCTILQAARRIRSAAPPEFVFRHSKGYMQLPKSVGVGL